MSQPRLADIGADTLGRLSPQLRRAACYVVDNPGEIATRSQRFVARAAQLPPPTFTRLAHAMGYESYDALRETCRSEILNRDTTLADKAQVQVDAGRDPRAFAVRHALKSIENIHALVAEFDRQQLEEIAHLLAGARRVALLGAMGGRPIVDYALYLANMSLSGWCVPGASGQGVATDLADLGPNDACLAFSIEPYAAQTVELTRDMTLLGVPVIALTDSPLSPLAQYASHCVHLRAESQHFFPASGTAIIFFEAVIGMIMQIRGSRAQKRIADVERCNHQLGEYWRDKPASRKGE